MGVKIAGVKCTTLTGVRLKSECECGVLLLANRSFNQIQYTVIYFVCTYCI